MINVFSFPCYYGESLTTDISVHGGVICGDTVGELWLRSVVFYFYLPGETFCVGT